MGKVQAVKTLSWCFCSLSSPYMSICIANLQRRCHSIFFSAVWQWTIINCETYVALNCSSHDHFKSSHSSENTFHFIFTQWKLSICYCWLSGLFTLWTEYLQDIHLHTSPMAMTRLWVMKCKEKHWLVCMAFWYTNVVTFPSWVVSTTHCIATHCAHICCVPTQCPSSLL